jgi:2-oxoglutarate dehydrogenase E2 component (dihydrolipoamide succinyltransferase)
MLTTFNEVNMTPINLIRNEYKEAFKAKHAGVSLGYMSFFTKAVTRALKLYPDVNSMMDGDYKIAYDFCDISIAVSGPGLMVPVVRNAENLTFRGVEADIKRLAIKARDGQITVDDMTGGTFTITNGVF